MAKDVSPEKMAEVLNAVINQLKSHNYTLAFVSADIKSEAGLRICKSTDTITDYADHFLRMYKRKHGVD